MNKPVYLGLSILEALSKNDVWIFSMILMNQNIRRMQNYYMNTGSFIIHVKTEDFIKILQMMLKTDMIHQMMKVIDHYQMEWIKNS